LNLHDVFRRNITRSINGVVKADQLDDQAIWQELDEFVVTRELTRHFESLVRTLIATIEGKADGTSTNGIWIAGFFGSGKSHFLKVLSYLFENREHHHDGQHRRAIDFFTDKLTDPIVFADLKRIVAVPTDTILFNIDTKADHRTGRDAILQVFLRVLNEKQGFSGDHPHVAHMERFLQSQDRLEDFHKAFLAAANKPWHEVRDAFEFFHDQVGIALTETLGQSSESISRWIDQAENNFALTVENFAGWVRDYLDARGPTHRIVFLVDEVGQFIGRDTQLMLNLQTITEQLGTVCKGRAWVAVTSQEDLDAVLGDVSQVRANDFSKIQGRFKTRLSLSSANVDEVIKKRLLEKTDAAAAALMTTWSTHQDIIKNQLSFADAGRTFRAFTGAEDFAASWPFAAYQFELVQRVFEAIRKAGATGLHLSQGERSTLDAFQGAACHVIDATNADLTALVPFHAFYASVEGFLDTTIKRTIDLASSNTSLKPFDITILRVLFLIRYIDELPGRVDNLVTLCVDHIDVDRLALRRTIETALLRLEAETLIARNGDLYFFLTNEERDIGREIKNIAIPSGQEERELGKLLFEDVLDDLKKHKFKASDRDFSFNRVTDDYFIGQKVDGNLALAFVTPIGDAYQQLASDAACILNVTQDVTRLLVRLPDDPRLGAELRTWLQTDNYVKTRNNNSLSETTQRILKDRANENSKRRARLVDSLRGLVAEAAWFGAGKKLALKASEPRAQLAEAFDYLVVNTFTKLNYITHTHSNAKVEIQSLLRANDLDQHQLKVDAPESNPVALDDLREYLKISAIKNAQVILYDLLDKRYGQRPYGWAELEVIRLVARLAALRELTFLSNAAAVPLDKVYEHFTSVALQKKLILVRREAADAGLIQKVRTLAKDLFGEGGPLNEDGLANHLRDRFQKWKSELSTHLNLAQTGQYPAADEIQDALNAIAPHLNEKDSLKRLRRFVEHTKDLRDLAEDVQDICDFYSHHRATWDSLRAAHTVFAGNRLHLDADPEAGPALKQLDAVLKDKRPFGKLATIAPLVERIHAINDALLASFRRPLSAEISGLLDGVREELTKVPHDDALVRHTTTKLEQLLKRATDATTVAHIQEARTAAEGAYNHALDAIEAASRVSVSVPTPAAKAPLAVPTVTPEVPGDMPKSETLQPMAAKAPPPPPVPPAPVMAPLPKRRVVEPKTLWPSAFIETTADIETFLTTLRTALESAIAANERVQLK